MTAFSMSENAVSVCTGGQKGEETKHFQTKTDGRKDVALLTDVIIIQRINHLQLYNTHLQNVNAA